jgi:hypothetical protein
MREIKHFSKCLDTCSTDHEATKIQLRIQNIQSKHNSTLHNNKLHNSTLHNQKPREVENKMLNEEK